MYTNAATRPPITLDNIRASMRRGIKPPLVVYLAPALIYFCAGADARDEGIVKGHRPLRGHDATDPPLRRNFWLLEDLPG